LVQPHCVVTACSTERLASVVEKFIRNCSRVALSDSAFGGHGSLCEVTFQPDGAYETNKQNAVKTELVEEKNGRKCEKHRFVAPYRQSPHCEVELLWQEYERCSCSHSNKTFHD